MRTWRMWLAVGAMGISGCAYDSYSDVGEQTQAVVEDDEGLRELAASRGATAHPRSERYDYESYDEDVTDLVLKRAELGRNLFFDKVLSGVEQTTCGTCHHSEFQLSDARNIARGVFCTMESDFSQIHCDEPAPPPGVDGNVSGPGRSAPLNSRNSPLLVNNGLFPKLMWNGRFHFVDDSSTDVNELDPSLGFQFPAPENVMFTRSLLTAQAHIPVTEAVEMTGDFPKFGEPFDPPAIRNEDVRTKLAARVSAIDAYHELFEDAYPVDPPAKVFEGDPEIGADDDVPYLAIGDSIGHFLEQNTILTDSPWDEFLAGDDDAISDSAKRGAQVFFGRGECWQCHSGPLFSDFENYNIGVPQVGPGTGFGDDDDDDYRGLHSWDFGLEEITGERGDRFKYRTPPLRGVALSSPYMHNGAYTFLEDAITHHENPRHAYATYDITQIEEDMQAADGLKPRRPVFAAENPVVIGPGSGIRPRLRGSDVDDLVAFMVSLTDPRMLEMGDLAPETVPSGLPVDVVSDREFPLYE